MKKIVSLVVCSLLLGSLVCFVGCGSSDVSEVAFAQGGAAVGGGSAIAIDPALVGRWVMEGKTTAAAFPGNIDLLRDGTGVKDCSGSGVGTGVSWKTDRDRIYVMHVNGSVLVWDYKISGAILTFTFPDVSHRVTYKKQ
jgi:hypothetical protein